MVCEHFCSTLCTCSASVRFSIRLRQGGQGVCIPTESGLRGSTESTAHIEASCSLRTNCPLEGLWFRYHIGVGVGYGICTAYGPNCVVHLVLSWIQVEPSTEHEPTWGHKLAWPSTPTHVSPSTLGSCSKRAMKWTSSGGVRVGRRHGGTNRSAPCRPAFTRELVDADANPGYQGVS